MIYGKLGLLLLSPVVMYMFGRDSQQSILYDVSMSLASVRYVCTCVKTFHVTKCLLT